jgi:hypothetical protein
MSLVEVTAGAWAYRAIPLETALIVSTTGVSRFAFRVSRFAFRVSCLRALHARRGHAEIAAASNIQIRAHGGY